MNSPVWFLLGVGLLIFGVALAANFRGLAAYLAQREAKTTKRYGGATTTRKAQVTGGFAALIAIGIVVVGIRGPF